ncbi:hypothetical protein HYPP_04380 [Hyphomicrobium sp. ghe19]|nr:hypothetical protein HYPP_04380 [Hyphomicrobium sp. ghe19]
MSIQDVILFSAVTADLGYPAIWLWSNAQGAELSTLIDWKRRT